MQTIKFSNFDLAKNISKSSKNYLKLILRVLILILLIFAAAGSIYEYPGEATNINFVLTLDTSRTFTQDEFDIIKESARDFIQTLPQGIKVGLVSFSEKSRVENKLTSNKEEIITALNNLQLIPQNERNIESSIAESVQLFLEEEQRVIRTRRSTTLSPQKVIITTVPKVIVLTTSQKPIESPLEEGIEIANSNGAAIYTIGVHLNKEEPLEKGPQEQLNNIAQSTGGEFFPIESKTLLEQAYRKIARITSGKIAYELRNPLLILVLVLLVVEWIAEYIRFGTIP